MSAPAKAAPGLLERDSELARIGEAIDEAARGRGSIVIVECEAGLGKSSLLQAAGELAVVAAHWSDRLSLRFLLYLAERIADLPLIVVAAARPHEPGAEPELLAELGHHPAAILLHPGSLSVAGVGRLAAAWFGGGRD